MPDCRSIISESVFFSNVIRLFDWTPEAQERFLDSMTQSLNTAQDWRVDNILQQDRQFGLNTCGSGGAVLEAGSGVGSLTIAARRRGMNIVGIDYNEEYVALARRLAETVGLSDADLWSVLRQGDATVAVFAVRTGRVRLVRHLEDGSTVALHAAQADETFAEAALFADAYHCDPVAEIVSEVTAVPKADLLVALAADPQACLAFTRALASHVRDLRARLELRNVRAAPERVLCWLRLHATGGSGRSSRLGTKA